MNIGIDFNIGSTKAAVLINRSDIKDCKIFETRNVLCVSNGKIIAGDKAFNEYLTNQSSIFFDLNKIVEQNGIVVNKQQISVERCLSIIFTSLFNDIKAHIKDGCLDFASISIPYDKYYFWHNLLKRTLSLIGIQKFRIIAQPTAFFCHPEAGHFQDKIINENRQKIIAKHNNLPWYIRGILREPEFSKEKEKQLVYRIISISQTHINVSYVKYGEFNYDILQMMVTHYSDVISRQNIEALILEYFISIIEKDPLRLSLKDQKNRLRLLEQVNLLIKTQPEEKTIDIDLPYALCEDGEYRSFHAKVDLDDLHQFMSPQLNGYAKSFIALNNQIDKGLNSDLINELKNANTVILGDPFLQSCIKNMLPKSSGNSTVIFGGRNQLVVGALNYSRELTGLKNNFVPLEVIPFSVYIKISGGNFVPLICKDTTVPTSHQHAFEITGEGKSKFVELNLTTEEGDTYQSISVWKIEIQGTKKINIEVIVDAGMNISIDAHSDAGQKLLVIEGDTFSFSDTGLKLGIKGKNIRQYVANQFNYMTSVFKKNYVEIFEPDERFYQMLKAGDSFTALRYLGHFLNLKSLPDIEMVDSKYFEEQGIGGYISGSKIRVPKYLMDDPYGFGYVLAHELSHYILIHEEQILLDDTQENEIFTEMYVVYSGMGKLFLNGFRSIRTNELNQKTLGYLDKEILQYIHKLFIERFSISISDYKKLLSKDALVILNEFVEKKDFGLGV